MLRKLREVGGQPWNKEIFLRKTQGIRVKTPCLLSRGGGAAGGTQGGQTGWQRKPMASVGPT